MSPRQGAQQDMRTTTKLGGAIALHKGFAAFALGVALRGAPASARRGAAATFWAGSPLGVACGWVLSVSCESWQVG